MKLFISHAVSDYGIVKSMIDDLIIYGLGGSFKDFLCVEHSRENGKDNRLLASTIRDSLIEEVRQCGVAVVFYTDEYKQRFECMSEMGWFQILKIKIIVIAFEERSMLPEALHNCHSFDLRKDNEIYMFCEQLAGELKLAGKQDWNRSRIDMFRRICRESSGTFTQKKGFGIGRKRSYSTSRVDRARGGPILVEGSETRLNCIVRDFDQGREDWPQDLRHWIREGRKVPTKYLYGIDGGALAWLKMINPNNRDHYPFFEESVAILRDKFLPMMMKIFRQRRLGELDYVSLGCGCGTKDALIAGMLLSFRKKDEVICYMPIDISGQLLNRAVNTVWNRTATERTALEVLPIQGDITELKKYSACYEFFRGGNLFSILGNTIGNSSENEIIESLGAMIKGDVVIFEVKTIERAIDLRGGRMAKYRRENWERHSMPLTALGVKIVEEDIKYGRAQFPDRVTVQAICSKFKFPDENEWIEGVTISAIHHYVLDEFIRMVNAKLGLTEMLRFEESGVGYYLAKKTNDVYTEVFY